MSLHFPPPRVALPVREVEVQLPASAKAFRWPRRGGSGPGEGAVGIMNTSLFGIHCNIENLTANVHTTRLENLLSSAPYLPN